MLRYMAVCLFLAVVLSSPYSMADSDGSFCSGPGYLAYELREGITPGIDGHLLTVVRFEPRAVYVAGRVVLKDFQVHRMICGKDSVEISGWGNVFRAYVVDIQKAPEIIDYAEDASRQFDPAKDGPEPPQFNYATPGARSLESSDLEHRYMLTIDAADERTQAGIEHHRKVQVIQSDLHGKTLQQVVLYDGKYLETID